MSDNWDDDDYDPNAQIAAQASDKLATLGLDEVIRQQNKPTSSITQAEEVKATGARSIATVKADQELSEKEKREAQLRLDAAAGMDLFGISAERKEPTFDDLRTKSDFQAFADKLGEQIANRHSDSNYLLFVNTLVDHITKPMTKIQLQSVRDIVQVHLDIYMKEEQQKLKQEQKDKDQKDKKKAKNKQVKEDYVEDEYDDYDEKFNRY